MYKKLKFHRNEEGQSLVEFALLLPVLMIILLGIVEFGFMFNAKITLNSAAREGARVYAITNATDQVDTAVNNTLGYLGPIPATSIIKANIKLNETSTIKMAKITVKKDVYFLTNFFDFMLPDKISMASTAEMRIEHKLATGG